MVNAKECLFCKIIRGEIPSKKVYEDENTIAFLDINPATEGHTLVVGKNHKNNIFDVDENELKQMIQTTKKVAQNIKDKLDPEGVNIVQNNGQKAGQMVSHIHFHVVPRYEDDQVIIQFPREQAQENELDNVLKKIKLKNENNSSQNQNPVQAKKPKRQKAQRIIKDQPKEKKKPKPKKEKSDTQKAIEKDIKEMDL